MQDDNKAVDLLGLKPLAKSVEIATQGLVDGASAFLSRICLPAAKEFGLLARDVVHDWRVQNLARIAKRAEEKQKAQGASDGVHASPKLVFNILEKGSWEDDAFVQDFWAGLLASSCTDGGEDDSNLIFLNILADMTKLEVRVVNILCENARKHATPNGLINCYGEPYFLQGLMELAGTDDIQRLDRELDHLRQLGLVDGGFDAWGGDIFQLSPTALALHMYVRCQGSRKSPVEFFGLPIPEINRASGV